MLIIYYVFVNNKCIIRGGEGIVKLCEKVLLERYGLVIFWRGFRNLCLNKFVNLNVYI